MYMCSCSIGECDLEVVCTRDVSECEVYCLVCVCVVQGRGYRVCTSVLMGFWV